MGGRVKNRVPVEAVRTLIEESGVSIYSLGLQMGLSEWNRRYGRYQVPTANLKRKLGYKPDAQGYYAKTVPLDFALNVARIVRRRRGAHFQGRP